MLKVGGYVPFSSTDYPGKLAAVVFVQGCPWRCTYCHNPHLQPRQQPLGSPSWKQIRKRLQGRQGLLDAVVFSGGEATLDPALESAIHEARELGFAIGLHTAGMYPQRLQALLPLLDWVGLDVKTTKSAYDALTGVPGSAAPVQTSLRAVQAAGVALEVRTTVDPTLHTEAQLTTLARELAAQGVRNYALQLARATPSAATSLASDFPSAAWRAQIGALFEQFTWRS